MERVTKSKSEGGKTMPDKTNEAKKKQAVEEVVSLTVDRMRNKEVASIFMYYNTKNCQSGYSVTQPELVLGHKGGRLLEMLETAIRAIAQKIEAINKANFEQAVKDAKERELLKN